MLDVAPLHAPQVATRGTVLVVRSAPGEAPGDAAGHAAGDVEIRVWPPEQVHGVQRVLSSMGLRAVPVLVDEDGVPGSLLVHGAEAGDHDELVDLLGALLVDQDAVTLGYLAAGDDVRRAGSVDPTGRDEVVFVDLHETRRPHHWQVRAFGTTTALTRLARAASQVDGCRSAAAAGPVGSVELVGPDAVGAFVDALDAAGLDGHVRVVRRRRTSSH